MLEAAAYSEVSGDDVRPSHLQVAIRLAVMRQHIAIVVHDAHVHKDGRSPLHLTFNIKQWMQEVCPVSKEDTWKATWRELTRGMWSLRGHLHTTPPHVC